MITSVNTKTTVQFDEEFLKEEVRCDYLVTQREKRIWAVEIDLLEKLLEVCNKHDIKFTVYSGTLLGTIRHKGFIPWDDDLDVCMTRKEYDKFLNVAIKEFSYPYFLQTALTDRKYFFGYARLRNSLTTGYILEYPSANYNQGIYIDIYVLDEYIENKKKLKFQLKQMDFIVSLINLYHKDRERTVLKQMIAKTLQYTFYKVVSYERLIKWYNRKLSKYNYINKRLSLMTHPLDVIQKYWCHASDFDEIIYLPYENIKVPVPKNYDSILTHMYGDYMKFPPVEKRGAWHDESFYLDPDIAYVEYMEQKKG